MSSGKSLMERHTDATQQLILTAAIELLERSGVRDLTVRATAKQGGMSERTIFRYYATRDEFLDAVATEVARIIHAPAVPSTIEELFTYPRELYSCFEEKADLVRSALHTDIYERFRQGIAHDRWQGVRLLLDAHVSHRSEHDRKITAANIRYYLAATAWHYYRSYFGFTLEEAIESAQLAIRLAINDITKQ